MMNDLLVQNLLPAQTDRQPFPSTIESETIIAPKNRFTFISGTVQIETIIPPTSGYCELVLCFTDPIPGQFLTTGNMKSAYQAAQFRPIQLYYDPISAKWYMAYYQI